MNYAMTTRIITLLFALFCLTFAVSAEPEAEYKQLTKAWTLHPDGSQEFRCSMELTLFTHTAMNGTFTKNAACQLKCSSRKPPMSG